MSWKIPYRSPDAHCGHESHGHAPSVLVADSLCVRYGTTAVSALRSISLDLKSGECGVLVGPNGAGKSTFLKTAAGLIRPQSGSIRVFDCPAHHCHPHTCYLPQRSEVQWDFPISVRAMVLTGAYVRSGWFRRPGKAERLRSEQLLEKLGIDHLATRQINALSGGQQQRVLLARALLHNARLYLLDEPFNAVDRETMDILCSVLTDLTRSGCTLLASTHFLETVPLPFDKSWSLQEGALLPSDDA